MDLPVMPPIKPMLTKAVSELPTGDVLYEPKWDGFRCLVFRDGDEVELTSRNTKPLTRYFPEVVEAMKAALPRRCVVDGELVVSTGTGLDFDLLSQRIHPADSRVRMLAQQTPASLVIFDLLALDDLDLRPLAFSQRRGALEDLLGEVDGSVHLTPATGDPEIARDWFERFEGSGFDGVVAKPLDGTYISDKRVQFKLKHHRSADCVVPGYRVHKDGGVGSLLLALYAAEDDPVMPKGLHHVGVCSGFSASQRRTMTGELAPYVLDSIEQHPWADWGEPQAHAEGIRMPGAPSRWSGGNASDWVPLRIELVVEVTYENFTNGRFRHPARFIRWRPDKSPEDCTYEQVDIPAPVEYQRIFT